MPLPSVKTPVPRHAKTLGISCQPHTSVTNVSAKLAVAWNGLLKKWDFKKTMFTLGSPGCSDVWLVGCSRPADAGDVPLWCVCRWAFLLLLIQYLVYGWDVRSSGWSSRQDQLDRGTLLSLSPLEVGAVLNTCLLSSYTEALKLSLPTFSQ